MKKKLLITFIIVILVCVGTIFFINYTRGYTTKISYIKTDNGNIFTKLYRPKKKGKVPLIIYSHGLGATYNAGSKYAKELTKYGIATLTFDFRGGSNRSKSNGDTKEMSIMTECEDLENLLVEVKKWNFIDTDNIILMGSSQGGAVSALVSSKHDDIKGTILLYPALSIPVVIHNWYSNINEIPNIVKMNDNITVGKKYFTDIWNIDVYNEIKKDTKSILIIQGTDDRLVSLEHSKKVNSIYSNSQLYEIKGAGHGFDGKYFEESLKHVIDYLKKINIVK